MLAKHRGELTMNRLLRGWEHTQVDDARPKGLHEHEAAVIAVTRDKDAVLLLRTLEQHLIRGSCQAQLGRRDNVVTERAQIGKRRGVYVLVDHESHAAAGLRCISSAATSAIAYRRQAWTSSSVRSG